MRLEQGFLVFGQGAGILDGGLQVDILGAVQGLRQPGIGGQVFAQSPEAVVEDGKLLGGQQIVGSPPFVWQAPWRQVDHHQPCPFWVSSDQGRQAGGQ